MKLASTFFPVEKFRRDSPRVVIFWYSTLNNTGNKNFELQFLENGLNWNFNGRDFVN